MALREDLISQGISFLNNNEIKSTLLSGKIQFLESKGLTDSSLSLSLRDFRNLIVEYKMTLGGAAQVAPPSVAGGGAAQVDVPSVAPPSCKSEEASEFETLEDVEGEGVEGVSEDVSEDDLRAAIELSLAPHAGGGGAQWIPSTNVSRSSSGSSSGSSGGSHTSTGSDLSDTSHREEAEAAAEAEAEAEAEAAVKIESIRREFNTGILNEFLNYKGHKDEDINTNISFYLNNIGYELEAARQEIQAYIDKKTAGEQRLGMASSPELGATSLVEPEVRTPIKPRAAQSLGEAHEVEAPALVEDETPAHIADEATVSFGASKGEGEAPTIEGLLSESGFKGDKDDTTSIDHLYLLIQNCREHVDAVQSENTFLKNLISTDADVQHLLSSVLIEDEGIHKLIGALSTESVSKELQIMELERQLQLKGGGGQGGDQGGGGYKRKKKTKRKTKRKTKKKIKRKTRRKTKKKTKRKMNRKK